MFGQMGPGPTHAQTGPASVVSGRLPRARFRCASTGRITAGFPALACMYPQAQRPSIEVTPCDHPFYLEQQNGLTIERAIYLARLVPGFEIMFDA